MTVLWPQIPSVGCLRGYCRVSTADQKLDMQIDALNRVGCHDIYSDHGVSGAKAKRPGLDRMLGDLRRGDAVVVFKLDRLGRSVLHLADLLTRFHNDGVHFCSIAEGINTTTSGGKLVYHIFSAVAEFHRDVIIENTVDGLAAARARGKRLGRPPKLDIAHVMEAHRAIQQRGARVAEMADILEVSPSTLRRRLMQAVEDYETVGH